jgi:hypothetical protein
VRATTARPLIAWPGQPSWSKRSISVWRIERRHQAIGVIVADLLRDSETWLVDEGLTLSAEPGMKFASRLCWPADFAITCGVVVPVNTDLIEEILLDSMAWLRHVNLDKVADNPRFATAIYRAALNAGLWTAWCSNSSRWPPNQTQNGQSQA